MYGLMSFRQKTLDNRGNRLANSAMTSKSMFQSFEESLSFADRPKILLRERQVLPLQ